MNNGEYISQIIAEFLDKFKDTEIICLNKKCRNHFSNGFNCNCKRISIGTDGKCENFIPIEETTK